MKHLIFKIDGQSLVRLDYFKPATGSVEYLTVSFEFTSDWDGTTKTAQFRKDDKIYPALINSSGVCTVPYEVLVRDTDKSILAKQYFYMSIEGVNGTRKITTDEVKIEILPNGQGVVTTPSTPTPDVFAQYVDEVKTETQGHADLALEYMNIAEEYAIIAEESARSLKNDYSNALKGRASGAVVRVDDVSPVEHYPSVKVYGKNLCSINEKTIESGLAYAGSGILFKGVANTRYTVSANFEQLGTVTQIGLSIATVAGVFVTECYSRNSTGTVNLTFVYPGGADGVNINFFSNLTANTVDDAKCQYTNIQIEKGDSATEYTPYIDPSTVTVTRCGKNILPYPFYEKTKTQNGITFTDNGDGTITVNGTATSSAYFLFYEGALSVKGKYTLSGMTGGSGQSYFIQPKINGVHGGGLTDGSRTYELDGVLTQIMLNVVEGAEISNLRISLMFEQNETATNYEVYNGSEYTPNTDGTVEGITSLAPTMTLLTDTEDVTVEVEYNRDINVVIADILSKLS